MKEAFEFGSSQAKTQARIDKINDLITEYAAQGITKFTVRQIFYQFVARDWTPNTRLGYRAVLTAAQTGRLRGDIDWDVIEDRTRTLISPSTWRNPAEIIAAAESSYQEDCWAGQRYRPEVWIEKQALIGVAEDICNEWQVPLFTPRGYDSTSSSYEAGKRFAAHAVEGSNPLVLYLGDHDPSGIHMAEDIENRLALFAGTPVTVRRLALNYDQVRRYRPPPNPTKEGDARTKDYVKRFGEHCWELDARDPSVLIELIRAEIESLVDLKRWRRAQAHEARNRKKLTNLVTNGILQ